MDESRKRERVQLEYAKPSSELPSPPEVITPPSSSSTSSSSNEPVSPSSEVTPGRASPLRKKRVTRSSPGLEGGASTTTRKPPAPPTILHVGAAVAHIVANWLSQTIAQAAHRGGIVFRLQTERMRILSGLLVAVGGAYRRSVSSTEEGQISIGSVAHVDVFVNMLNNPYPSTAQVACCGLMQIVNNGPLAVTHLINSHHLDAFLARAKSPRPVWRCAMLELLDALPPHRLKEPQRLFLFG